MKSSTVFLVCILLAAGTAASEKLKVNVLYSRSFLNSPKVDFYAESLCPYCRRYVTVVLKPLFDNGLAASMDLTVYYAGNAKYNKGKLRCQHGADECYLNRVLNCGIAKSKDVHQWFPFIECIEVGAKEAITDSSIIKECTEKAGLGFEDVMHCAEGSEGKALHMKAYRNTKALQPPHRWVPWVVANGVPMYDLAYSLDKILCMDTPKADRPDACYDEPGTSEANAVDVSKFRTYPDAPTLTPVT